MDVVCEDDLDEFGEELDDPIAELLQDVVHMLLEDYGTNADAVERSIGLEASLSDAIDPSLRHRIETKLTDDARIIAAQATITQVDNGQSGDTVSVDLKIQANAGELGVELLFDGSGQYIGFRRK